MSAGFDHKQTLLHLTGALSRRLGQRLREALKPLALQPAQFVALCEIEERQGLTQAELAVRLEVEQPGVARTLAALETEGWIERTSLGKGRAQGLYLSDKAREALPRAAEIARTVEKAALSSLTRTEASLLLDELHQLTEATRGE